MVFNIYAIPKSIMKVVYMIRLDKYLADCGIGTRKEIKKLIRGGRVKIEGIVKPLPELKIDENTAKAFVDGRSIAYRKYVYLMLNKPSGYISATWDKRRPVVLDLVPEEYSHFEVFPVGRLDIDTVGLCILTNDGGLAHRILSPVKHVPKRYFAVVDGELSESDINAFSEGMDLGDFTAKPSTLEILKSTKAESEAVVEIFEGKFHQVKRMFERVGKNVLYLKRIAMNKLTLDDSLAEGELRELTQDELELLTDGTN